MFASHSQIICTIFGIDIYCYGVILALSMLFGVFISEFFARKFYNLNKDIIIELAPYLIIFGIIGARLYYCILNYNFYLRFPTEIFAIRHGGISIHGALIGGLIGLIIFAKKRKISILKLADISSIGLVLAQSFGRWGNFFNSEAFGYPTNLPWKLYVAPQYRPIPYTSNEYFHPTFLYESLLNFILFFILFYIIKNKKNKNDGNLALLYILLYSFIRIFVESFRIDSVCYLSGIPIAIVVSIILILLSIIGLVLNNIVFVKKEGD